MMNEPTHPNDIQWIEGELPDVQSVPYNCRALIWKTYHNATKLVEHPTGGYVGAPAPEVEGKFKAITIAYPWKDKLNPLRWHDGYLPIGNEEKIKFYAWLIYPDEGKVKC